MDSYIRERRVTSPYEEGSPLSKICYIGEAPARNELRLSRPFVGPSGKLLDQCSHNAGIVRKELYLLNIFPFMVDKDGAKIYYQGELLFNTKGPTEAGLEAARPFFERLERCKANVLVPLGGTALRFISEYNQVMKWRGSIVASTGGRKMVPTIHPAAVLHGQYLFRYRIVSDLKRAKEESLSPTITLPKRNLIIDPSYSDVMDYMKFIGTKERFATDIEALNHQVSCFCLTPSWNESMCIPLIAEGGQHRWTEEEEADIWSAYAALMGDSEIKKINQNILFDIHFLFQQMGIRTRGPLGDPMIAHHILYPDFPKGLDFLCSVWTREPYYKDDGKMWRKPWEDLHRFWEYNARDGAIAIEVLDALEPELDKGYRETYEQTMAMIEPLTYMMTVGMKVDRERLEETKEQVKKRLQKAEADLVSVSEREFSPYSPKQCIEYFYVTKGIKPYISHKTGRPTTDDKAMARIVRRYNLPEARLVQETRTLRKLLGTYLEVGIDKDNRIRCSYNIRGTVTGRLSSSQTIFGTGMNIQNLHPAFKGFLVAD